MKTSELTGATLDWAVAKILCVNVFIRDADYINTQRLKEYTPTELASWVPPERAALFLLDHDIDNGYSPSTNWSQGGPIIDREKIAVRWLESEKDWEANVRGGFFEQYGPTPLIAAMRCYVASKLGEEVEIPEELK